MGMFGIHYINHCSYSNKIVCVSYCITLYKQKINSLMKNKFKYCIQTVIPH